MKSVCPTCGCTRDSRCVIDTGAGLGLCASAGDVPGHTSCSACVSELPKRRLRMRPESFAGALSFHIEEEMRAFLAGPDPAFLGTLAPSVAETLRALIAGEAAS